MQDTPRPAVGQADRLLSLVEVTRLLGISRSTFYRLRSTGRFPPGLVVTGRVLWRESDVARWQAETRAARPALVNPTPAPARERARERAAAGR